MEKIDLFIVWFSFGLIAFLLVFVNSFRALVGKHRGWQALLFASLACNGAALLSALLAVNGYVRQKAWDSMTDVVPTLVGISAIALSLGIFLNLLALWLHLRGEKKDAG